MNISKKWILLFIVAALFLGGCGVLNIFEIMATPTNNEKKVPAEYNLKANSKGGILVYVERSPASGASLSLEDELSRVITGYMVQKAKIKGKYVQPLTKLSQARMQGDPLNGFSPIEIGKKLNKSLVLHVIIDNNRLYQMSNRGYYNGSLVTRSTLYDSETGKILWPAEKGGRVVRTKVELETKGEKVILDRLQAATGHCIVRSLYGCIKNKYRANDEVRDYSDKKYW